MHEFVTLDRSHPQFRPYLLGNVNREKVAIPVKSFNVNQSNEQVTFQLVPLSEIQRPNMFLILTQIFRIDLLALTFMPALVVVLQSWSKIKHYDLVTLALLSLLFIHASVFCRNDFVDHMRGIDRLNEKSGSRIIQRGWLRAVTVQKLYLALMAVAVVLATPVLLQMPELILLSVIVALLGVVGYSHLRWGAVHWIFGDLAIWCCLGVFITMGMSWVAHQELNWTIFLFGSYFGLLSVIYVEVRHMISMVVDYEARLMTLPVRLGFDKAKLAVIFLMFMAVVNVVVLMTVLFPNNLSILALPLVAAIVFLGKKVYSLQSPLSSHLYELPKDIINFYVLSSTFFLLLLFV